MVQGRGIYGIDVQLEGMKVAVIARPPVLFGRPKAVDSGATLAVAGVEKVVELPALTPPAAFKAQGGVAVVARNTWAAIQGRSALEIEWEHGANASYDSATYREELLKASLRPGHVVREEGDVDAAPRVGPASPDRRVLRAPPGPGSHGASHGHGEGGEGAGGDLGLDPDAPEDPQRGWPGPWVWRRAGCG